MWSRCCMNDFWSLNISIVAWESLSTEGYPVDKYPDTRRQAAYPPWRYTERFVGLEFPTNDCWVACLLLVLLLVLIQLMIIGYEWLWWCPRCWLWPCSAIGYDVIFPASVGYCCLWPACCFGIDLYQFNSVIPCCNSILSILAIYRYLSLHSYNFHGSNGIFQEILQPGDEETKSLWLRYIFLGVEGQVLVPWCIESEWCICDI